MRLRVLVVVPVLLAAATAGAETPARLRLATTTSVEHSGLLQHVLPPFEQHSGLRVEVIAVGSGKALRLAENGDVDAVLSHAPALEQAFLRAGFGVNRREVMANDFVVVGPAEDPAGLRGTTDPVAALRRIAAAGAAFVSRGDESGTHEKEKELWRAAAVAPAGAWYVSAGQGMGAVLRMADERRAHTLSDRATYLTYRQKTDLEILVAGDAALSNPYAVIATNPARHPEVNYLGAMRLIAWLTSPAGQQRIGSLRHQGQVLFQPTAVPAAAAP